MPVYAVQYDYVDRPEDLTEVRPEHRAFLAGLVEDGALLASGPFRLGPDETWSSTEPVAAGQGAGALLLVRAESARAAAELLEPDPFNKAGLIERRSVRGWVPVLGPFEDDA